MAQLTLGLQKIRLDLAVFEPHQKTRIATSPARKTKEGSAAGTGGSDDLHATVEKPETKPPSFNTMGPNNSDPVLLRPAERADLYSGPVLVQPPFAGLEGSMFQGNKPMERHSLPPAQRSPGPRKQGVENSAQMTQMMNIMQKVVNGLQVVQTQVGNLLKRESFPPPIIPHDDDAADNKV